MKKNKNFLEGLESLENKIESFDNQIQKEELKNLLLVINKEIVNDFKIKGFEFFRKQGIIDKLTNFNFFKICVGNLETIFLEKYIQILEPNERELKFYKGGGRLTKQESIRYEKHINLQKLFLKDLENFYDRYFNLLHTYFVNELEQIPVTNYSINFFFYDFWELVLQNFSNFKILGDEFKD